MASIFPNHTTGSLKAGANLWQTYNYDQGDPAEISMDVVIREADPPPKTIYVFYSNEDGKHLHGTAKIAMEKYGAIWGQSRGRQGDSYAICVKGAPPAIITKDDLALQISDLISYANTFYGKYLINPLMDGESDEIGMRLLSSVFMDKLQYCNDLSLFDDSALKKWLSDTTIKSFKPGCAYPQDAFGLEHIKWPTEANYVRHVSTDGRVLISAEFPDGQMINVYAMDWDSIINYNKKLWAYSRQLSGGAYKYNDTHWTRTYGTVTIPTYSETITTSSGKSPK